jgi:hypothetical protein
VAKVEIVGESFYKDSFKIIRDQLGAAVGERRTVKVELVQDPGNTKSNNGKAVAVYVLGNKVGYVSELTSKQVYERLNESGGKETLKGEMRFGDLRELGSAWVAIKLSVEVKTRTEVEAGKKRSDSDLAKREAREELKKQWLKNPNWSTHELQAGDTFYFSGFENEPLIRKIVLKTLGTADPTGVQMLVFHPDIIKDSAKLRDALGSKKPPLVTDLGTFLQNNPKLSPFYSPMEDVWNERK